MSNAATVTYRSNVLGELDHTTKLRWQQGFDAYRLADEDMATGSTLGSPSCQMVLKATGAIEKIYCVDAGAVLLKTFVLKHWDDRSGMKLDPERGHFFMYPAHQEHRYMLTNGVYVREDVFVLSREPQDGAVDPPVVYYAIEFTNDTDEEQHLATYAFTQLNEKFKEPLEVEYDPQRRALVAWSEEKPDEARIVGCSEEVESYEVSIDHAKAVTARHPGRLSGDTQAPVGFATGILHCTTALQPRQTKRLEFRLGVSARGAEDVQRNFSSSPGAAEALHATQAHYRASLDRSVVLTPNPQINRGAMWAKANMERVLLKPPSGWSVTNDPTMSTKCVARDSAWFCAGTDYFRPDFSRACLLQFAHRQKPDGMIVEDYDMLSGETQDDGLNINDDTPLFIWGVWHHYALTHDREFLEEAYDAVVQAGRYIASQRNDQGLVWCTSTELGSKGITGWRNVIKDYRLSGAVTEVNSESYGAFCCIAALARAMGDDETSSDFEALAESLREAIDRHLYNPGNGLYYLNIDVDGKPRSDITADMVFPLLFDAIPVAKAAEVVRRLSDRDFWTSGGMRALPRDAVNYSPTESSGCLGGVWNGMTFWFAKAAAAYAPDFMDEALTNGFENYARDPQRNNTVPGQFSEWLNGETLVNQGMHLSPWFPPRYLWAVVEGALGLDLWGERPRIAPNMPSYWKWCGLRNAPLRGRDTSFLVACTPEMRGWANAELDADFDVETFDEDISGRVGSSGDSVVSQGFSSPGKVVAFIGNTTSRTVTTALRIAELEGDFTVRRFDSLSGAWKTDEALRTERFRDGVTVVLGPHGFHLFELTR